MLAIELLNWHVLAAALSGAFAFAAAVPYIRDILKGGKTKPNVVSFGLWTIITVIAFAAQLEADLQKHQLSLSLVILGFFILNTFAITILGLCGYGYVESGLVKTVLTVRKIARRYGRAKAKHFALAVFKKYGEFEVACLVSAVLAIVLWQITGPSIAIFFCVVGDLAYPVYLLGMNGAIFVLAYFSLRYPRKRFPW